MRLELTKEGRLLKEAGFDVHNDDDDTISSQTLFRLFDEVDSDRIPVEVYEDTFVFVLSEHDVTIPRSVVDHEEVFVHTVFACMAAIYAVDYDLLELLAIRSHLE